MEGKERRKGYYLGRKGEERRGKGKEGRGESRITPTPRGLYITVPCLCVLDNSCMLVVIPTHIPYPFQTIF